MRQLKEKKEIRFKEEKGAGVATQAK